MPLSQCEHFQWWCRSSGEKTCRCLNTGWGSDGTLPKASAVFTSKHAQWSRKPAGQFLSRMSSVKWEKNLRFSYISTPEYIFLICCVMKWEVRITHSLCIQKCSGCREGNWIHMNAWTVSRNHSGTGFLARIFLKMRWACHFKENNWQNLIPMIKFKFSCENDNFGKLYFGPLELDRSSIFKDSSNEIGGNHRSFHCLKHFAFSRTAELESYSTWHLLRLLSLGDYF